MRLLTVSRRTVAPKSSVLGVSLAKCRRVISMPNTEARRVRPLLAHYVLFLKPAFEYFPRILSRKIVPKFDNPRDLEVCEPF
jgi:hypothetical protein